MVHTPSNFLGPRRLLSAAVLGLLCAPVGAQTDPAINFSSLVGAASISTRLDVP